MTEILVTSSALILALLVLRRVFRQRIARRVQYALWALVLARLLVPVHLPAAGFSVLRAAGPVLSELEGTALYLEPMQERAEPVEGDSGRRVTAAPYRFAAMGPPSGDNTRTFTDENWVTHQIAYARQIDLAGPLRALWCGGMAVMACWLAVTNLRFWRRLRRNRIPLELAGCPCPVYLVEEGLISPCLFGLLRPAIYLTPAALETEASLRHVLAHESTHARHLDPLWALLRGVCLAVYWFDPLVWWAAASRADCELACDEGALRRLGEGERLAYGQTLLGLIPVRRTSGSPLLTATTMTADKRRLAERITRIAEGRKMGRTALCAALLLAVLVCAAAFTGGGGRARPLTAGELAWFNEHRAGYTAGGSQAPPVMRAGEREGDLVRLYYTGWDDPYGWWNCVTLEDRGDGRYQLVSDQACTERIPAIPTSYPALPSVEIIPLNRLKPYAPPEAEPVRRLEAEEIAQRLTGGRALENYSAAVCLAADGDRYLAVYDGFQHTGATAYARLDGEGDVSVDIFPSLFGCEGVVVTYRTWLDGGSYGVQCNDFYQVEEDGSLVPLLRAYGEIMPMDLDGDGDYELTASDGWRRAQLFYQRGETLFCADLGELVPRYWPEAGYMAFGRWDRTRRCLCLPGYEDRRTGETVLREIYFDGEDLVVYK